jgi:hypothetical protein
MTETEPENATEIPVRHSPVLRFDWEDWLGYLDASDISEEQKRELIETLWAIVTGFVDLGFELNPTQQICGEVVELKAVLEAAVLSSGDTHETEGKDCAA